MVNKSSDMVMIRGTNVPFDDTFIMGTPSKKWGLMLDLMSSSALPTVVEGVVVVRRPDFWRPLVVLVPFMLGVLCNKI